MKLLYTFIAFIICQLLCNIGSAQTAKVYRSGALLSTHTTLAAACSAANMIGDSILISAHTFYEHDIPAQGGQTWQGTYTATDSTIIDAQSLGRVFSVSPIITKRALRISNIIMTKGETVGIVVDGGGINKLTDSVLLKGGTIIRNCHAKRNGGGAEGIFTMDNVKIMYNSADSLGGGVISMASLGNTEVSYNKARIGGGVYGLSVYNFGLKIDHNIASECGGGVGGTIYSLKTPFDIIYNQAPLGAGFYGRPLTFIAFFVNGRIYNPRPDGKRQNEIFVFGETLYLDGAWFGCSDTTGLIIRAKGYKDTVLGKHAIANWSVNRGVSLSGKDTLFPIGATFTRSDGTNLSDSAFPQVRGNFTTSKGTFITPNPLKGSNDTLSSLFRTYIYGPAESGSKPISFVCNVDADTFRATPMVWGRDTSKLGIGDRFKEMQVLVYPNPAKDILNISGTNEGSELLLFDVSGKLIISEKVKETISKLDISAIPAGNYILKIRTKEGDEGSATINVE